MLHRPPASFGQPPLALWLSPPAESIVGVSLKAHSSRNVVLEERPPSYKYQFDF